MNDRERALNSPNHPLLKHYVKLAEQRKYREETGSFIVTGHKLVEAIPEDWTIRHVIVEEGKRTEDIPIPKGVEIIRCPQSWLRKITGQQQPEGIAAEIALPNQQFPSPLRRLLVLDGVADPGNLGTLQRSALAFGWQGIFLLPGCCDPLNPKVVRSAMGATFLLPTLSGSWQELNSLLKSAGLALWAADAAGGSAESMDRGGPIALCLGSESHGLSPETRERLTHLVGLPIAPVVESLNVAVAGGILLYLLGAQR